MYFHPDDERQGKCENCIEVVPQAALDEVISMVMHNLSMLQRSAKNVHTIALREIGPHRDALLVENVAINHLESVDQIVTMTERNPLVVDWRARQKEKQ